ncbi:MAG: EamA family transporter RarD [Planctomycetes bacterium]|nr:EamA family transporter RarD [Planctomycetota bacterium]
MTDRSDTPAVPCPSPSTGNSPSDESADRGSSSSDSHRRRGQARAGVFYGLAAYLWWGLVPIYFKAVAHVPAPEVLAHRVVWAFMLLAILMRLRGKWRAAPGLLRDRRTMVTLCATTMLIALNWFVFIWAVANDKVLQASLGYFINPLVNVLLGFLFLRERLTGWQKVSVILAATGVAYLAFQGKEVPTVALVLAGSFGLYGLLRKTAKVDAILGLGVETALLLPLAIGYLAYLITTDQCRFGAVSWRTDVLLASGGIITAVPLLWFTNAARRLRLATLGFLQYIAPTGQFLLAVALYGEDFTQAHAISFGCIWTALAIYSVDAAARSMPGRTKRSG